MRAKLRFLALCVALAAGSLPAAAEDLLLEGATVHTVSGETLNGAPVLVANGKIVAVGGKIELTAGVRRVDLSGLHLYPGMIAATTSLGLTEINAVRATQDTTEVGEVTPDVRAWIAVNPDSELIPVARANGVTHALVLPLGGTVSGQSGLIALAGWTTEQMTVKAPVALHLFWPSMGLDLRPKEEWKGKAEWKSPEKQAEERRARLKELDDLFDAAAAYAKARAAAG
ncbi:MAG: amidohydrolase, partial [Planctomycetes bacterium]|nr:amidohydrolase [Planctomycetota bacterium]